MVIGSLSLAASLATGLATNHPIGLAPGSLQAPESATPVAAPSSSPNTGRHTPDGELYRQGRVEFTLPRLEWATFANGLASWIAGRIGALDCRGYSPCPLPVFEDGRRPIAGRLAVAGLLVEHRPGKRRDLKALLLSELRFRPVLGNTRLFLGVSGRF